MSWIDACGGDRRLPTLLHAACSALSKAASGKKATQVRTEGARIAAALADAARKNAETAK